MQSETNSEVVERMNVTQKITSKRGLRKLKIGSERFSKPRLPSKNTVKKLLVEKFDKFGKVQEEDGVQFIVNDPVRTLADHIASCLNLGLINVSGIQNFLPLVWGQIDWLREKDNFENVNLADPKNKVSQRMS